MPGVDHVANRLTNQMCADREELQVLTFEQVTSPAAIRLVGQRLVDLEVVTPAGEFQAVVAKVAAQRGHVFERFVGPLSREKRYRPGHQRLPRAVGWYDWDKRQFKQNGSIT